MDYLHHVILLLTIYNGASGLDEYTEGGTTTVAPPSNQYEYIVSLKSTISESAAPKYLIDAMYSDDRFTKVTSSSDILQLFKFNTLTLNDTLDILQTLNVQHDVVFSISALNYTLNVTQTSFNSFYESLKSKLVTGQNMREVLSALQINTAAFSEALSFGDAFDEFAKGHFSKENMNNVTNILNITTDVLFSEIRSLFHEKLGGMPDLVGVLRDLSINQSQALTIWQMRNVSWTDVYNSASFKAILDETANALDGHRILGVFVKLQEVFLSINKASYGFLKPYWDLILVEAVSLTGNPSHAIDRVDNSTDFPNIVLLKHDESMFNGNITLSSVSNGYSKTPLLNCSYVTITNTSIDSVDVPVAIYNDSVYLIPVNSSTDVIEGSALICNGTLYGLAREAVNGHIIIDSFFVEDEPTTSTPINVTDSNPPSTTQNQDKANQSGASILMNGFVLTAFCCSALMMSSVLLLKL